MKNTARKITVRQITVHVAKSDVRGVTFDLYAPVLHDLIGSAYAIPLHVDEIDILTGASTVVLFDGRASKTEEAAEILDMVRTIAHPKVRDGNFG
jgi:hypothetical protein